MRNWAGLGFLILGMAAVWFVWDLPVKIAVHSGAVFGDYPDPDRPGHLRGAVVTTAELGIQLSLALVCTLGAILLYRNIKRTDPRDR